MADPATAGIPVVYVSGFGSDLQPDETKIPNVKGSISKPFTSETLIKAVRSYLPESAGSLVESQAPLPETGAPVSAESSPSQPIEPFSLGEREPAQPTAFSVVDPVPNGEDWRCRARDCRRRSQRLTFEEPPIFAAPGRRLRRWS
jgi:hypothetical protein